MTKKNSNKQTVEAFNKEKQALEAQVRELQVKNILSVVPFETEEKRTKVLQGLVNSNVTIDFIRETYEPFIKQQNKSSSKETKLPQKPTYIS